MNCCVLVPLLASSRQKRFRIELQLQLAGDLPDQPAEVGACVLRCAQRREIDHREAGTALPQPERRAQHEGGLPHLPRGQDIDVLAGVQKLEQLLVFRPGDVEVAPGNQRAANLQAQRRVARRGRRFLVHRRSFRRSFLKKRAYSRLAGTMTPFSSVTRPAPRSL